MEFIVVYDKKKAGNPIVAIHSQRFVKEVIELKDIHPGDDPNERGVVVVPGEIVSQMVIRNYKRDREGNIKKNPVHQEKTKELISVMDTALDQNILIFGEPVIKLVDITDLKEKRIRGNLVNAGKGVIGIGDDSGLFKVTCMIDTGFSRPEVSSEKKNWKWKTDREGNIIGMELIEKQTPEG